MLQQAQRTAEQSGCTIASRWPLQQTHEVDLNLTPRTADFPCTTLIAELTAPEPFGSLVFVNHFPNYQHPFELERELQAVAAARAIEAVVGERRLHVVLAGDFSSRPDTANVRFWRGRQSLDGFSVCYRDAWDSTHPGELGHTSSPRNPLVPSREHPLWVDGEPGLSVGGRIDYIMVREGHHGSSLDVTRCELLFDEPVDGVWASDHFGVVADLVVPERPADQS